MNPCTKVPAYFLAVFSTTFFLTLVSGHSQTVTDTLQVNNTVSLGASGDLGKLEWRDNGIFISKGSLGQGSTLTASDRETGTKFVWYPRKAALRVGTVNEWGWEESDIGFSSISLGTDTIASGIYSFAAGNLTYASGAGSAAFGCLTNATGNVAVATGLYTDAVGDYSTAMGYRIRSNASYSIALGRYNVGNFSSAGNGKNKWVSTDPILEIGNGTPEVENELGIITASPIYSNALTLFKDGVLRTANKAEFRDGVRVPPKGDLSMGEFTAGQNPANLNPLTGLKYPGE